MALFETHPFQIGVVLWGRILYNRDMFTGFSFSPERQSRMVRTIFGMARWNPYVRNWPVVLEALRELWENGKVSELKSPFYEPLEKPMVK